MNILYVINKYSIRFLSLRYIVDSLKKRRGKCLNCGICCGDSCRFKKKGKCLIYHERFMIKPSCREFPIDEFDKIAVNSECGYYWK